MKISRILMLVFVLALCCSLFGCVNCADKDYQNETPELIAEQTDEFTVVLQNNTGVSFTAWADGTDGAKTVVVKKGEKLVVPKMICDELDEGITADNDYYFGGWYYKDKDGKETKLDLSVSFTLKNLNVESYNLTLYARVFHQWLGPR